MSRLDNYYESINALAARQPEQFIHASEERYRNIIRRVAEQAVSSGAASIILLAGPSASGKTTTAGKIAQALVRAAMGPIRFRWIIFISIRIFPRACLTARRILKPYMRSISP